MKFTQGQLDAMAPYLADEEKKSFMKRFGELAVGYTLAFGSIGALACEAFFSGPEWVGNAGAFIYLILMILSLIGVSALFVMWLQFDGEQKRKLLFGRIRNGATYLSNLLRGLVLYIPAFIVLVGGGMWWLTTVTTIMFVFGQLVAALVFADAYKTLDREMGKPNLKDGFSQEALDRIAEGEFVEKG